MNRIVLIALLGISPFLQAMDQPQPLTQETTITCRKNCCCQTFPNAQEFAAHKLVHSRAKNGISTCFRCRNTFPSGTEITNHLARCSKKTQSTQSSPMAISPEPVKPTLGAPDPQAADQETKKQASRHQESGSKNFERFSCKFCSSNRPSLRSKLAHENSCPFNLNRKIKGRRLDTIFQQVNVDELAARSPQYTNSSVDNLRSKQEIEALWQQRIEWSRRYTGLAPKPKIIIRPPAAQ